MINLQLNNEPEEAGAANNQHGHLQQTKEYSSDVLFRWIDFQLTLYKINSGAMGGIAGARFAAYTGITAYESVVPGMPAYQSLSGQLTAVYRFTNNTAWFCLSLAPKS